MKVAMTAAVALGSLSIHGGHHAIKRYLPPGARVTHCRHHHRDIVCDASFWDRSSDSYFTGAWVEARRGRGGRIKCAFLLSDYSPVTSWELCRRRGA